jgi:flagellar biosynthetic protein FliR
MTVSVAQAQMYFLVLTRVLAMVVPIPMLGGQMIPAQVRVGLGLLISAVIIPWQPLPASALAMSDWAYGFAIFRELIIGSLAGFAASLTFGAVQVAGEMMGLNSGYGGARVYNPTMGQDGTPIDQLFVMIGMLLFMAVNGHYLVLMAIQRSFTILPPGSPLPDLTSDKLIVMTAQLITTGVQMALPVLGVLILTDLTLGLLSRVAPQVQVFFLGLPVKMAVALIAVSMTFAVAIPAIRDIYNGVGMRMLQLITK